MSASNLVDFDEVLVASALRRIDTTIADFGQIVRHMRDAGVATYKVAAVARAVASLEQARASLSAATEVPQ